MIKLYDYELSANCYKQRLILSLLDVPYESVPVDFFPGLEHKSDEFKKINPLGHIPVIDDDGYVLWDAHAILVYLAAKYDPSGQWYPTGDPQLLGEPEHTQSKPSRSRNHRCSSSTRNSRWAPARHTSMSKS